MVIAMPARSRIPAPRAPVWATCGSMCIRRPMPWPPNSSTTPQPSFAASSAMAAPMSPSLAPPRTTATPASRQRLATSTTCLASALTVPIRKVMEVSP